MAVDERSSDAPALAEDLRRLLDDRAVSTSPSVLDQHSGDMGPYRHPADVVVFADSTAEVATVLSYANERRIPVVPYGAGTSNGGLTVPLRGGISLDVSRMDSVLAVYPEDSLATVQAGVLRKSLNARLAEHGLQFPVDPGADASLGGMASTNASGTTTVRYGSMRGNVKALQVVLPDGSVIRTGTRARKSSAGYDMTSLFVGAEGTLGVITEVTVRLFPIPEKAVACLVAFPDVDSACTAVVALTGADLFLNRAELLDGPTIGIVNDHFGSSHEPVPTLFVEIAGPASAVRPDVDAARELCADAGSISFVAESDPTRQSELWQARHNFGHAFRPRRPGAALVGTDICVPVSELPGAVANGRERAAHYGMEAVLIAHAGDGNFHLSCLIDPDDPREAETFNTLYSDLVDDALRRGGTCTGEHGIGIRKIPFLEREHGDLLSSMRAVKAAFDPNGIMNPGKIFREIEGRADTA